jgi:uncharacterized protein (TIGR00730 family)
VVALPAVGVFCGSSTPLDERFDEAARSIGSEIARRRIDLVYGGGSVGLMGAVADAALAAGGRVIGVIPTGLFHREIAHPGLTELHEVASMHERKQLMYERSTAFIALPGGLGTLEELAEVATWSQLGLHQKPMVLFDVEDFWQPLVMQLDRMVSVGLLNPINRRLVQRAYSAEEALAVLAAAEPAEAEMWISPRER